MNYQVLELDPKEGLDLLSLEIKNVDLVFNALHGGDGENGVVSSKLNKLGIKFGSIKVIERGNLVTNYKEKEVAEYMKSEKIDLIIDLNLGTKNFTAYTMDLTKKYIEINADYRS